MDKTSSNDPNIHCRDIDIDIVSVEQGPKAVLIPVLMALLAEKTLPGE
jgi:hypothetical protein